MSDPHNYFLHSRGGVFSLFQDIGVRAKMHFSTNADILSDPKIDLQSGPPKPIPRRFPPVTKHLQQKKSIPQILTMWFSFGLLGLLEVESSDISKCRHISTNPDKSHKRWTPQIFAAKNVDKRSLKLPKWYCFWLAGWLHIFFSSISFLPLVEVVLRISYLSWFCYCIMSIYLIVESIIANRVCIFIVQQQQHHHCPSSWFKQKLLFFYFWMWAVFDNTRNQKKFVIQQQRNKSIISIYLHLYIKNCLFPVFHFWSFGAILLAAFSSLLARSPIAVCFNSLLLRLFGHFSGFSSRIYSISV